MLGVKAWKLKKKKTQQYFGLCGILSPDESVVLCQVPAFSLHQCSCGPAACLSHTVTLWGWAPGLEGQGGPELQASQ